MPSIGAVLFVALALVVFGSDLAAATDGTWIEALPPTRRDHTAILDPTADRMLVFGGSEGNVLRNEVLALAFSTQTWTEADIEGAGPSPRMGHSAVYDPIRERMLVFGGWEGTTGVYLNDIWALSLSGSPQWTLVAAAGTPPSARYQHTAVYDPVGDRMIVFGGWSSGGRNNDTWALSLPGTPAWTSISPGGVLPPPRSRQSAIIDPIRRRMLVFAGQGSTLLNDLWALSLDGAPAWSAIVPPGQQPWPIFEHTAAYDPVRDRMIAGGGTSGLEGFSEWWVLPLGNGASWARLPLHFRWQHSSVYDPQRDALVIYGGTAAQGATGNDNATWRISFNPPSGWTPFSNPGTPVPRQLAAATIYDPIGQRMIVYGGQDSGCWDPCPSSLIASYSLVDRRWTGLPTGTSRYDHSAIYDPVRHQMVVFGGSDFYGLNPRLNDTWVLPLTGPPNWNEVLPAGAPPARRRAHTAIYDPVGDRMLIFGGIDSNFEIGPRFNDVWQLSLGSSLQWTLLAPLGVPPSPRENHSAIYDLINQRMLIFGGRDDAGLKNDLWALSLAGTPQWTLVAPEGIAPSPRETHTAIYDQVRNRMVVFGGTSEGDAWSLDLVSSETVSWSQFDTNGVAPSGRQEHTAIYDPVADQMVVCGGWSEGLWGIWIGSSAVTALAFGDVTAVPAAAASTPVPVLLSARPNPASGAFEVLFESAGTRSAELELINVGGRRVARQNLGTLTPGNHQVRFEGQRIPAGTYFLRLTQDGRSASTKVSIIP
jgi:hypothetical protein